MNESSADKIKYSEVRVISMHEMQGRPGLPSQIFREIEADIIGRLARSVALSGRRFEGWPAVELSNDKVDYFMSAWRIVATVSAR